MIKFILLSFFLVIAFGSKGFILTSDTLKMVDQIEISFGETISSKYLKSDFTNTIKWKITGDNMLKKGKGSSLLDFIFNIPGKYEINLVSNENAHTEGHEKCTHSNLPNKIVLIVSKYKMKFLFDQIKFSEQLVGELNTTGMTIEIPVFFESFDNLPVQVERLKMNSAGVGTNIHAELQASITLSPGLNVLVYNMNGTASKNSYIMLDFIDINNSIQSFSYPSRL